MPARISRRPPPHRRRQFARVVGVDDDIDRLLGRERRHQRGSTRRGSTTGTRV